MILTPIDRDRLPALLDHVAAGLESAPRALFRRIADNLAALGLRREDVWVNLVEVAKENWSFGNGIASYAPETVETAGA